MKIEKLYSGIDPTLIKDFAFVGAHHLENIVRAGIDNAEHFAEFSKKMIEDFGEKVKPYLKDVWEQMKKDEAEKQKDEAHKLEVAQAIENVKREKSISDSLAQSKREEERKTRRLNKRKLKVLLECIGYPLFVFSLLSYITVITAKSPIQVYRSPYGSIYVLSEKLIGSAISVNFDHTFPYILLVTFSVIIIMASRLINTNGELIEEKEKKHSLLG